MDSKTTAIDSLIQTNMGSFPSSFFSGDVQKALDKARKSALTLLAVVLTAGAVAPKPAQAFDLGAAVTDLATQAGGAAIGAAIAKSGGHGNKAQAASAVVGSMVAQGLMKGEVPTAEEAAVKVVSGAAAYQLGGRPEGAALGAIAGGAIYENRDLLRKNKSVDLTPQPYQPVMTSTGPQGRILTADGQTYSRPRADAQRGLLVPAAGRDLTDSERTRLTSLVARYEKAVSAYNTKVHDAALSGEDATGAAPRDLVESQQALKTALKVLQGNYGVQIPDALAARVQTADATYAQLGARPVDQVFASYR